MRDPNVRFQRFDHQDACHLVCSQWLRIVSDAALCKYLASSQTGAARLLLLASDSAGTSMYTGQSHPALKRSQPMALPSVSQLAPAAKLHPVKTSPTVHTEATTHPVRHRSPSR